MEGVRSKTSYFLDPILTLQWWGANKEIKSVRPSKFVFLFWTVPGFRAFLETPNPLPIYFWLIYVNAPILGWFYGPDVTLQDCLAFFFSEDELKGDNMYSCEKCKKLRNGLKFSKVSPYKLRKKSVHNHKIYRFQSRPIK